MAKIEDLEFKRPTPTITDLLKAMHEVRERWPYAELRSREDRLEFYNSTMSAKTGIPVAVLDLKTGGLTMADMTNVYRTCYPHLDGG